MKNGPHNGKGKHEGLIGGDVDNTKSTPDGRTILVKISNLSVYWKKKKYNIEVTKKIYLYGLERITSTISITRLPPVLQFA
jgi:hypothetical protein